MERSTTQKLKKIQERALKIVYNDFNSDYQELLTRFGTTTMLRSRHICILLEVFKSKKEINPSYVKKLLSDKEIPYSLRDPSLLIQPLTNTTNFGLRSFAYLGSKLWNDLDNEIKIEIENLEDITLSKFKSLLRKWSSPKDPTTLDFYV